MHHIAHANSNCFLEEATYEVQTTIPVMWYPGKNKMGLQRSRDISQVFQFPLEWKFPKNLPHQKAK